MSYKKLKKEEITVVIEQEKNGSLNLLVGMYEKDMWRNSVLIRLVNFPEHCGNLDKFRFVIDGAEGE